MLLLQELTFLNPETVESQGEFLDKSNLHLARLLLVLLELEDEKILALEVEEILELEVEEILKLEIEEILELELEEILELEH